MVIAIGYKGKFDDTFCDRLLRYFCEFTPDRSATGKLYDIYIIFIIKEYSNIV